VAISTPTPVAVAAVREPNPAAEREIAGGMAPSYNLAEASALK
jgi:hypothetical protein